MEFFIKKKPQSSSWHNGKENIHDKRTRCYLIKLFIENATFCIQLSGLILWIRTVWKKKSENFRGIDRINYEWTNGIDGRPTRELFRGCERKKIIWLMSESTGCEKNNNIIQIGFYYFLLKRYLMALFCRLWMNDTINSMLSSHFI